jgi:hypothetical protein
MDAMAIIVGVSMFIGYLIGKNHGIKQEKGRHDNRLQKGSHS